MSGAAVPQRERLAPRGLTLLYLGFAYLCLVAALLLLLSLPQLVGGFFYHPKMLAVVHLVTLGWITSSILGYFHLVGPVALRATIAATWSDYVAFVVVVIGVTGMVSHFWIDRYGGMVWSAGTLLVGLAMVAARAVGLMRRAKVPWGVKLHILLAFCNLLAAGLFGVLIGLEKQLVHVLPGYLLHSVYAHAHLATLGWATMMVMGLGYRLLPMILPAAMPPAAHTAASAILAQAGLVVLVVALPAGSTGGVRVGALLAVSGLAVFVAGVATMLRQRKPSPKDLPRPDYGTLHALQGLVYLALAAVVGLAMALAPPGAWKIAVAPAYGVIALLGFLAQMVLGVAARILPMFAWTHQYVRSEFARVPPSQYTMHRRGLQAAGLWTWTAGVPMLAWGLSANAWTLMSIAAALLLVAVLCNAFNTVLVARQAYVQPAGD